MSRSRCQRSMSQYSDSGNDPERAVRGTGQFRTGNPAATGQYNVGGLASTGNSATGAFSTGQFSAGPEAEARRSAAADAAVNAFPRHIVTAVLVSHDGARWLEDSLKGILGQLRAPQRVLAVDTGSKDDSLHILDENLGPEQVLQAKRNTGFGTAVNHALKQAPPTSYDDQGYDHDRDEPLIEWIWILHDDAEPAPDALLRLLEIGDFNPDAAVIGPKIRDWHDRERLLEIGVTATADGRRWTGLDAGDHDQGQHAEPTRVLSVSSAGMLVRRDVWDRLKGFDRALPLFRDDLDFCWRVNNAGYDVLTAPKAILWHAEASARSERRISAGVSRPHFEDRQHALYTLTVNSGSKFPPLTFLRLFLWSLVRAAGLLINKTPLKAADEVLAAFAYASRVDRIVRARRFRKRTRSKHPVDLTALFPQRMAVFRATFEETTQGFRGRGADDDDLVAARAGTGETGPVSEDSESYDAGVPWIVRAVRMPGLIVGLSLTLLALVASRNVLTGGRLMGGALLPAPTGANDLWSAFAAAWHPVGTGSTSASPPYLAVVALVATIFLGHASLAVSILLLGSVPLAGLTAYAVLRRTVESNPLRVWGSVAYALLPAATGAIAAGRLGSTVGIVLLPLVASGVLVAMGGAGRSGSMRAAWSAAFGLAVATAFAPIVWVLAAALAIGAALTVFWRSTTEFATVLIRLAILTVTPLAVLAPWSLQLLQHPGAFLLEPGLPTVTAKPPAPAQLLLANPGGAGTYVYWLTGGLLAAALAALLRTGPRRRIVFAAWTLTFAGLAAGLLALQTHPTALSGGGPQQPWTGIPAAAIGFGLIVAAVIGAEGAREYFRTSGFSWRQPAALILSLAAVAAPLGAAGWWAARGVGAPLQRAAADFRPAVVSVDSLHNEQPRALILSAGAQAAVGYGIVRGTGAMIGDADYTIPKASADRMKDLVGGLLSNSGGTQLAGLAESGIQFVVAAKSLPAGYLTMLDGTPGLKRLSVSQVATDQWTKIWQIDTGAIARLTLRAVAATPAVAPAKGAPAATDPTLMTITSAGQTNLTAVIPAAAAGVGARTLLLAEDADVNWTATVDGTALARTTVDGWAQGFTVPAAGGVVQVTYSPTGRDAWLIAEGLFFLFALVMALPTGRRSESEPSDPAEARVPAAGRGGRAGRRAAAVGAKPVFEPGVQPEYGTADEPEYGTADEPEDGTADGYSGYEGDGYEPQAGDDAELADEYRPQVLADSAGSGRRRGTGEFQRPGTGEYERSGTGEYERPAEYGGTGYFQPETDEYGQPAGRTSRHGTGEFERPNLDEHDGYGYEGGYR